MLTLVGIRNSLYFNIRAVIFAGRCTIENKNMRNFFHLHAGDCSENEPR